MPEAPIPPFKAGKRVAAASPSQHISLWNQKKKKKSTTTPTLLDVTERDNVEDDMIVHLSLAVGSSNESVREVVDPNQPQKSS